MIRTGWRIVLADQATTAFDGEGARLYGGRWNSVGVPMVYASEHQSLAALEIRVHIDRTAMRRGYKCFFFQFDDGLMDAFRVGGLPKDWMQEPPPASLQLLGDDWINSGSSVKKLIFITFYNDIFSSRINHFTPLRNYIE